MEAYELRSRARYSLGPLFGTTWVILAVLALVHSAVTSGISAIPYVGGVASLALAGPLLWGLQRVFLKRVRSGRDVEFMDYVDAFRTQKFSDILVLGLLYNLFIMLWSLLFIIPGLVKSYSYSMSFYISQDNPDLAPKECIDRSRQMMDGHKGRLFYLDLTFIGWYIVGALCFGVGTLWVVAYHQMARAHFYEELVLSSPQFQPRYQAPSFYDDPFQSASKPKDNDPTDFTDWN